MGWKCSHVDKRKAPTNHILVVCYNMENCGHEPLDVHLPTKALFNLQMLATKGVQSRTPSLVTWRKRLVGGPKFENMKVAMLNIIFIVI